MGQRAERVAREIQRALGGQLLSEVKDPRVSDAGFITITHVRVTDDLSIARVSISVLDSDETKANALIAGLTSAAPFLKRILGRELQSKKVPELRFHLDEAAAQAKKVEEIFRDLEAEKRKRGETE